MYPAVDFTSIKPADLPAPPQAALTVLKACTQDNINNEHLAKLVTFDPILTAELLRIVNSSYFGLSREIQTTAQALTVLGQKSLRNLVLCLSVKDVVRRNADIKINVNMFWEDALRRAACARILSPIAKQDPDEGFTSALLQDFGLLVLFYIFPQQSDKWPQLHPLDPQQRYTLELTTFETTHTHVIKQLMDAWCLPADMTEAIANHHNVEHQPAEQAHVMSKILFCADWVAAIYSAHNKSYVIEQARRYLHEFFSLSDQDNENLFSRIPKEAASASSALGLGMSINVDYEQLMRQANVQLAEDNISFQELTWELEKALQQRDLFATELNRELEQAREIQVSLLPAGKNDLFPVCGINDSAKELSGDFYDFFSVADGKIYFCLGDVSGKGANAAILMAKTAALFRCLGKQIFDPAQLLTIINNELCETSIRGMYVTLIAGLYDPSANHVKLINAGHPPAIVFHPEGRFDSFEADSPPLGIIPNCEFSTREFSLNADSLYLFSDGVIEDRKNDATTVGLKRLLKLIIEFRSEPATRRLPLIVQRLKQEFSTHLDDITLVVVENNSM